MKRIPSTSNGWISWFSLDWHCTSFKKKLLLRRTYEYLVYDFWRTYHASDLSFQEEGNQKLLPRRNNSNFVTFSVYENSIELFMSKVRYSLIVQIYILRTLKVEHDLETFQRPWSTWVVTLWAFQRPKHWKWSIKKYRTFVIMSMDENCRTTWTSLSSPIRRSSLNN